MADRKTKGALSGAASGAATGMAVGGPWGALAGGVLGAAGGLLGGDDDARMPPPVGLPPPVNLGGVGTNAGAYWRDPYTGLQTNYAYDFDPSRIASELDSESAWNQFMGRGNESLTGNLDWQIKELQQRLAMLQKPGAGATRTLSAADYGVPEWADPTTGKFLRPEEVNVSGQMQSQGPLFKRFMMDTHGGDYGRGSLQDKFGRWINDAWKNSVSKAFDTYESDSRGQEGNAQLETRSAQDLQNQIDYLTQQRGRIGGPSAGTNPLMGFLTDTGAAWSGGGGADSNSTNLDAIIRGGLGANVSAPKLDMTMPGRLQGAMDWRAEHDFRNQRTLRDMMAARRGMASSSVAELADIGARESLQEQLMRNQLESARYGNDMIGQQFGMDVTAADLGNRNRTASLQALGQQRQNTWQDYMAKRAENDVRYSRTADMWDRLNSMRQQGIGNEAGRNAQALQGTGALAPMGMQYADWRNQANLGNVQQENAARMAQAQMDAARSSADSATWMNAAGALGGAVGSYFGNRPGATQTPRQKGSPLADMAVNIYQPAQPSSALGTGAMPAAYNWNTYSGGRR